MCVCSNEDIGLMFRSERHNHTMLSLSLSHTHIMQIVSPPEHESHFVENILMVPSTYLVNDHRQVQRGRVERRCAEGG